MPRSSDAQTAFDRTPPKSIEAERSVLGAMLLNNEVVGTAVEILRENAEDVFYDRAHQHIYQAITTLFSSNRPVDAVTLVHQLNTMGVLEEAGGPAYVGELTGAVPTSANVEYYAKIVLDASILRRLITACTNAAGEAYRAESEVDVILDRAEAEIFAIAERRQLNPIYVVGDLIEDGIERIEKQLKSRSGITGVPTGVHELDTMLGGLQGSDMIVLAARPSVGKTAFSLSIGAHVAARQNKGVLLFSLEMGKEQLIQRLLCMEGEVNSRKLREGFMAGNEFNKVVRAATVLENAPFYIDDTANISVLELRSKARRHASQHELSLIIVDYLQLMQGSRRAENRQVEISEISRAIKGLARELRVPIIALSQLSREAEKDDSGAPKLAHLRESGAIEQDADVVMMLFRPPKHESEGNENLIKLHVAKHRNGPTGMISMLFEKDLQRFRDIARGPDMPRTTPPGTAPQAAGYDDYDEEFHEDDTPF